MTSHSVPDGPSIHPMGCGCDRCAPDGVPVALPVVAAAWGAVVIICAMFGPDRLIALFIN